MRFNDCRQRRMAKCYTADIERPRSQPLRFGSKVSGRTAINAGAERYFNMVSRMADNFFWPRIEYWNEGAHQWGFYDWQEVYSSIGTYQEVCLSSSFECNFESTYFD
ncbi:hypothetical protein GGR54DRAFT_201104 [Hypoxylon sp. NC1633]|nr:hypothetical protein GGR54DRAFT_201104 [Hypoxylon sp. NC1633]